MRHTLFLSLIMVAGCIGVDAEPGAEPGADPGASAQAAPSVEPVFLAGESEQGRHILGSFADTLAAGGTHFRVSPFPSNRTGYRLLVNNAGLGGVNGTHLIADDGMASTVDPAGADPWFVGAILPGAGGQLRIRGVGKIGTTVISTVYYLDYQSTAGGNPGPWVDYCPDGSGGIALSGYYDTRRIHTPGAWLSFACANGVAQKCNGWGYPASNVGPGDRNWDHHQACTAMANADYCRSGTPYTREETPILIRDYAPEYVMPFPSDLTHPSPYPGDPDTYYFEAGWRPGDLAPVCLSKIRWASLPPDPCPTVLPDPRTSDDPRAKFCDDMTIAEIQSLGALIDNGSKMMDAPLQRWRNPATGDVVATIRGYPIDRDGVPGPDPGATTWPFTGYTEYLGVDSMILRNLPGTLDPIDMYPLFLQQDPITNDRAVAHDPITGHVVQAFEGYSFLTSGKVPGLLPLNLCNKGSDYRTTIGSPTGCTFAASLKYALPPL